MNSEQLKPREFEKFRSFIYEQSGIRIGDRKISLLSNRIRQRLRARGFGDFNNYYRFLTSSRADDELEYFLDAITTNETFFLRTPAHYDWLRTSFIPEVSEAQRSGRRSASLRFWSAACADGAEPYSIAICIAENRNRFRDWQLSILGTDISEQQIMQARESIFKERHLQSLTTRQRKLFFDETTDHLWTVKPELKKHVTFAGHNLIAPMQRPRFDCIFLCNVLIYFDRESKQTVLKNVLDALVSGGYLVIGPSEGVYEMLGPMERVSPLVYRKAPLPAAT